MRTLEEILTGARSVGIAGHVHPDGDCVGSCLGLWMYLQNEYPQIESRVHLEPIPDAFRFLTGADRIQTEPMEASYDVFFALDCGDEDRLGPNAVYFKQAKHTVCIDHHISNRAFAQENHVVPDASSTSELICELIGAEHITKEMAEALYMGIVHDTGVFQYSCTSSRTMELGGMLMNKGIDYSNIVADTFFVKTYTQNRLMGQALLNATLHLDDQVIVSFLSAEEQKRFMAGPGDTDGIVAQLRGTKGVHAAAFIHEMEKDVWRVSLRADDHIDVSRIASVFGGGGHRKAAGCTLTGTPDEVSARLLAQLEEQLTEKANID